MAVAPESPQPPPLRAAARDRLPEQRAALLLEWMPAILHRLNNLTGVVLGMSDLLASAESDTQKRDRLTLIRDQAQLLADILRALGNITVARGEPPGLHDLRELVQECIAFTSTIAKSRLQVEFDEPRGITVVHVRPDELRWLLAQLFHVGAPVLAGTWGSGEVEQLRVRMHGSPERVCLFLTAPARVGSPEPAWLDSAELERCARAIGSRVRSRVSGGTWCARLVLPGVSTRG